MVRPITATRERILAAALTRFSQYGFRRTSMEDIAAEAGVSRASLYSQFQNKEEIFRSLAAQLHDEAIEGAEAALREPGPLAERLQAGVEAKMLRFLEIGYASPHGSELLGENTRLCGDLAASMEARFDELLTGVLKKADRDGRIDLAGAGLSASEAAELLARSMSGLKGPGVSAVTYRKRLAALLRVFVTGLGAQGLDPQARPCDTGDAYKTTASRRPRRQAGTPLRKRSAGR
ncbi:MAG TPA: TetR/AcrR family transcriptional regulator [Candidatus Binatia bacterium]|jgi:AcrR family transcriptional regulator